jgi:hypothetical protein
MSRRSSNDDNNPPTRTASKEMRDRDAALAMQEYLDEKAALAAKTARLRALRLAKEANAATPVKKIGKSKSPKSF